VSAAERLDAVIRRCNPFMYKVAITRGENFFDRKVEIDEAMIVCEQTVRGAAGGVAILGGRSSGKSSVLNALQRELKKAGIPAAKISLDQGMVETGREPSLFKLMLNDLTDAARDTGVMDRDIAAKIKQVLQGVVKLDSLGFEAYGFSLVAKAAEDQKLPLLPYALLRDGLKDFLRTLKAFDDGKPRGAILMLDEGDHLTGNRTLLEVLRNVFQETPNMGLVIAGTSKLLSGFSEVFSPIQRFFTKIEIGPFAADSDVQDAISNTIELAKQELLSRSIRLNVRMHEFIRRVAELSGRAPYDFNMLSYFAFDIATSRLRHEGGDVTMYLRLEKDVLDAAIKQLRGTREYAAFLDGISSYERRVLDLLSKCRYGASVDELVALLTLDGMGEALRSASVDQIVSQLGKLADKRQPTKESLDNVHQLGERFSVRALNPEMGEKPIYRVEDQWVKTYFTYSALPTFVDLDLGLISSESGILSLPFGDPISSILDSVFLHRVMGFLADPPPFRVNSYPNDGASLYSRFGRIVNAAYTRVADGRQWHFSLHLEPKTETQWIKTDMGKILEKLRELGLIRDFSIKERFRDSQWS